MIAGKPVHDAGSDVRAAGQHAPGVSDQERPGRQPTVLGVRGPADVDRHPSGRAQGVRSGRARTVHRRAAAHGVPGADRGPEGLVIAAEGPAAARVLGPGGVGPHGQGGGRWRGPG